jgi:predicted HicB family RNase H-like nuclease
MSGHFNVQIPSTLVEGLKQAAKASDRSAASFVRQAVREAIKREVAPAEESKQS